MKRMMRPTILIVDDHRQLRTGVARILSEGGFDVIGQAEHGEQALEMATRLAPDVITLDLSMPGKGGLQVLPTLRKNLPEAVIVVLTMNMDSEQQARQAGADGYVLKHRAGTDLIPAIRAGLQSN